MGPAREATGGNGFGNFRDGNHHWDKLRSQREITGGTGFGNFREKLKGQLKEKLKGKLTEKLRES